MKKKIFELGIVKQRNAGGKQNVWENMAGCFPFGFLTKSNTHIVTVMSVIWRFWIDEIPSKDTKKNGPWAVEACRVCRAITEFSIMILQLKPNDLIESNGIIFQNFQVCMYVFCVWCLLRTINMVQTINIKKVSSVGWMCGWVDCRLAWHWFRCSFDIFKLRYVLRSAAFAHSIAVTTIQDSLKANHSHS